MYPSMTSFAAVGLSVGRSLITWLRGKESMDLDGADRFLIEFTKVSVKLSISFGLDVLTPDSRHLMRKFAVLVGSAAKCLASTEVRKMGFTMSAPKALTNGSN